VTVKCKQEPYLAERTISTSDIVNVPYKSDRLALIKQQDMITSGSTQYQKKSKVMKSRQQSSKSAVVFDCEVTTLRKCKTRNAGIRLNNDSYRKRNAAVKEM